ncbi:MAG TPA: hypothetical protein IAC82_09880 [Candidatus Merdivicinus intestinigallinarum]|nr:hypothetical protein [Candidatus Merdivicinus intestinigallinarum]
MVKSWGGCLLSQGLGGLPRLSFLILIEWLMKAASYYKWIWMMENGSKPPFAGNAQIK